MYWFLGTQFKDEYGKAQNNEQARECTLKYLTPQARAKLAVHKASYTVVANNAEGNEESCVMAPLIVMREL